MIADLRRNAVPLHELAAEWEQCRAEWNAFGQFDASQAEALWRRVHRVRRDIVLRNPLVLFGPLVFIKQAPGIFSHQLTQYYGSCARPGGGIHVLESPGKSMTCRALTSGKLPEGSYPILVQPVLDRKCVACHNPSKLAGKVDLTGKPEKRYTASYNALAPRVPYSAWNGNSAPNLWANGEPTSTPNRFGARGCRWMQEVLKGHHGVGLTPEETDRLTTWMDTNALFYGTHKRKKKVVQSRI